LDELLTAKIHKNKPCLVACSVLKDEIQELQRIGKLEAQVVFVSKYFHVDYYLLEKNLRRTLTQTIKRFASKPVLVYGDLCLGPNGEMKKLADEFGIVKVDALNCIDCLLGGKGKVEQADPHHEFMFFDPGMIDFFRQAHEKLLKEGIDEEAFQKMFRGIKGIVLLDTLGKTEECKREIAKLQTGLPILETLPAGIDRLEQVINEALSSKRSLA
jgi:hypothetical protein